MTLYHWILLLAFSICGTICIAKLFQVLFLHRTQDFAQRRGSILSAILYSFSGAMSPLKKETAYLHLPTYAAGIIYHIGTFLSFALLLVHFANFTIPDITSKAAVSILFISAVCGASIFFKRLFSSRLKSISTPDDYFSNLLVTGFHIVSALTVVKEVPIRALLIYASVIFLYIPLGKLSHLLYFFTSRIHLGILFGSRGIWPMKRRNV